LFHSLSRYKLTHFLGLILSVIESEERKAEMGHLIQERDD